ncbi:uncharacterized protein PgNI_09076 [Pyricularia grisea]|uniref:Uncharacterized protein n=1 Tax=Pyricularia grisea TaxID=148305 RepID=A0A6P8ARN9_PYRGI|nr:uncharacterized protein PgNI_09076 [Pyricularia grisea]TLD04775.1 hypothetical protein PgNI_09076 [Pyricularia grisea]
MFSKLLTARDPETGELLSNKQLWAESNLLIIAGSDTASTALAATLFYLSRSPKAYARVANEVRGAFPDPETVKQGPQLASCAYLRACLQEALRLSSSASGAMWREALLGGLRIQAEDGDSNQAGKVEVPAGLEVGTGIFSLNHSAHYFRDPLAYRPERWMAGEAAPDELARARAAFATFSIGPRNCVSKGLAMVEMAVAMAAVVARYDFRAPPGEGGLAAVGEYSEGRLRGHFRTKWAFTSEKDGPWLQFKRFV